MQGSTRELRVDAVEFIIEGDPIPWARPSGKHHRYTTKKHRMWLQCVALRTREAFSKARAKPFVGPIGVWCVFVYTLGERQHRKREPVPRQWKITRPDLDNLLKGVVDGMQGIAYDDDNLVAWKNGQKLWGAQGEAGHTRVRIAQLHDFANDD